MKRRTLQVLHRIRSYHLEVEQAHLLQQRAAEDRQQTACARTSRTIADAHDARVHCTTADQLIRSENFVRDAHAQHDVNLRQLALLHRETARRIQATLNAKRRREMIGRLIDNLTQTERAEDDLRERKELDDLSQLRRALKLEAQT